MKYFLGKVSVLGLLLMLTACSQEQEKAIDPEILTQATRAGESSAIIKIIQRAETEPCQPIYLFNHLDEDNKQEVNLINIECEALNLPGLTNTEEQDIKTED